METLCWYNESRREMDTMEMSECQVDTQLEVGES